MRPRFVSLAVLAAWAAHLSGCNTVSPAPATAITAASSATVWSLNRTDRIAGHPLTVLGQPAVIRDGARTALQFDGAHDGIVFPVTAIGGLREFTIEIHFRPARDGAAEQRFFHTQDSAGNRSLLEIRLMPDGRWTLDTFLLSGKNSLPLLDRTLLHSSDQWHWVALRYDGHRMTSFVDGVQELTGEVEFPPMLPDGRTSVGVRLNEVYWFKGAIGEVRVSPVALPADQLSR